MYINSFVRTPHSSSTTHPIGGSPNNTPFPVRYVPHTQTLFVINKLQLQCVRYLNWMCIFDLNLSCNRIFTGFHSCKAEQPSKDEDISACTYRAELKLQALYACKCKDCFPRLSERVPKRDRKISWIVTLVPGGNCSKGQINPTNLKL